jgi:WD40 repeat protein
LLAISIGSSVVAVRMTALATSEEKARRVADEERGKAVEIGDVERWERYRSNIAAAAAALRLDNRETARRALDAAPQQHRNWEWRYLDNQLDGASLVLAVPGEMVGVARPGLGLGRASLSPDGRQIAAASNTGAIYLWDTSTTSVRPSRVLRGHGGSIESLIFRPDGRQLATGATDGTLRLWDLATGQESSVIPVQGYVHIQYSSDGKRLLSVENRGPCRLWDASTGKLVAVLGERRQTTNAFDVAGTISPDSRRVALALGKEVRLYDASTGQPQIPLGPHEWMVEGIVFSPDGKRICTRAIGREVRDANGAGTANLWNAETGKLIAKLPNPRGRVDHVVFSADSTLLATAISHPDSVVRLWNTADGQLVRVLAGHANSLTGGICFSPDGTKLLTASMDQTARLWDLKTGTSLVVLRGHNDALAEVSFSPDGNRLVTGSNDHTMRLWNATNGDLIAVLRGHEAGSVRGRYVPDGSHVVSFCNDGTIRIWDVGLLERNGVLRGHTSFVYDVAFSPDGTQVASAAWDATVRLWDVTTGRQTGLLPHEEDNIVSSVAYSPDGKLLASVSRRDNHIHIWDLTTRKRLRVMTAPTGEWAGDVRAAFSRDGRLIAAGSHDGVVRLWDVNTGKPAGELHGHKRYATDVAFHPDGTTLASCSFDGTVRLWDLRSQTARVVETGKDNYRIAFSADGKRFATRAGIFDVESGQKLADLPAGLTIYGLAFSPDGTRLAIGYADDSIRLVDVASRQFVAELHGHSQYVFPVAWSPDGTMLLSGSGDGTVRVWDSLSVQQRAERAAASGR